MYELFYGLGAKPFNLTPDPDFFFGSKQHRRARAYLDYGFSLGEGFIVITGEVGAGKTTVLRSLTGGIDSAQVVVAHLRRTQISHSEVLRSVAAAFGLGMGDLSDAELPGRLEAFLAGHVQAGRRCVLIVDEAQNLSPQSLEELRLLSNLQLQQHPLIQGFLVGQPELRRLLADPGMEQFRQRVTASCHIGPLDAEDVRGYVEHRLRAAGSQGLPTFDEDFHAALHECSAGTPRRINTLMDRLLLSGFLDERNHFCASDLHAVARELQDEAGLTEGVDGATAAAGHGGVPGGAALDRLDRVERTLIELGEINRQSLEAMRTLVESVARPTRKPRTAAAPKVENSRVEK